jgi:rod shape determining protein RodA
MIKSRSILGFDVYLLFSTIILVTIGILFIYSSGVTSTGVVFSTEYIKQIIWAVTGLGLLTIFSVTNYSVFRDRALYIFLLMILLLVVTRIFGRVVNGARSWLGIGDLGMQPSEFMKIASCMMLAKYFDKYRKRVDSPFIFLTGFLIALIPIALIMLQPDMGTALVYFPIFLFIAYAAGSRLDHIFFLLGIFLFGVVLAVYPVWVHNVLKKELPIVYFLENAKLLLYSLIASLVIIGLALTGYFITKRKYFYWLIYAILIIMLAVSFSLVVRKVLMEYQIMRLIVFLDPSVDPQGAGWNIIQSVTAVGSGGLWGKGFLQGTQSHYQYLPQQSTDFIFSILSEEWGFFGCLAVFVLFLVILIRGLYVLTHANDTFGYLLGTGIVSMIFFHFIVNIGMTIGIMPITGIPLFFLSYGGSSLWTVMIGIGILMSVYQRRYNL